MVICAGMGGALVDQARGELLEKPPPPNPAPGTEAALTKKVPPSPWKLGETTTAAFSLARKESERPSPPARPLNPPRGPGPAAERAEFVVVSESSLPRRTTPASRLLTPPRPPKPAPNLPGSPPNWKSPLRPAGLLARRSRFVSTSRCAIGSKRGLTSRAAPFSTIFPSNLPLSFSMSLVPPSKYTTSAVSGLSKPGDQALG